MALRLVRKFTEALIFGVIGGIALLILAPVVLGWRPYTVLTGSMRPGIQPGDVVMDRPIPITKAHVGDVVTFSDPTRHGNLVTHRIRSIAHRAEATDVETRGDANNTSERWTIATKDRVGLVVYTLPKIGRIATAIRNPIGILLIIVVPVLLIGFGILRKIWQDDDDEDTQPANQPPTPATEPGSNDTGPRPDDTGPSGDAHPEPTADAASIHPDR